MKILEVKLLAFGPFTDKPLKLDAGQEGFHIVYGPNEAGKSSALRALRQMLYGIPERSLDDFIHPYAKIRIGGVLRRSDGTVLELIRRKGRIHTLRAPDDETLINESHLQTFLGGVDADLFATMFGIDHADLVSLARSSLPQDRGFLISGKSRTNSRPKPTICSNPQHKNPELTKLSRPSKRIKRQYARLSCPISNGLGMIKPCARH